MAKDLSFAHGCLKGESSQEDGGFSENTLQAVQHFGW